MEKSWIFVFFSRSPEKLIFQGKVMEFYTNRQFCARCMAMAVLWIAYFFHYFLSSLLSFTLSRECIYINVCLVMVVAVRAGHLDFSTKFKFMVKLYSKYSTLSTKLVTISHAHRK